MARGSIYTRLLKDGSKSYEARIRLNGKPVGKRFSKKKDAEEWLDRHSTDVRNGTYRELNKGTFEQYIEHWKKTHLLPGQYKPSTLNSYRCNLARLILPELGAFNILAISSAEINSFAARLLRENELSPISPII